MSKNYKFYRIISALIAGGSFLYIIGYGGTYFAWGLLVIFSIIGLLLRRLEDQEETINILDSELKKK